MVSVATLVDLWYVTQTTRKLERAHLNALRAVLLSSPAFALHPIDLSVADASHWIASSRTASLIPSRYGGPFDGPPTLSSCR